MRCGLEVMCRTKVIILSNSHWDPLPISAVPVHRSRGLRVRRRGPERRVRQLIIKGQEIKVVGSFASLLPLPLRLPTSGHLLGHSFDPRLSGHSGPFNHLAQMTTRLFVAILEQTRRSMGTPAARRFIQAAREYVQIQQVLFRVGFQVGWRPAFFGTLCQRWEIAILTKKNQLPNQLPNKLPIISVLSNWHYQLR